MLIFLLLEPLPHQSSQPTEERKALSEVKNIPSKESNEPVKIKKTVSSKLKPNGTENQPVPSKLPKTLHKPHSSSSLSSSDEDAVQSRQHGFVRPGNTPGRSVPAHSAPRTPGFSFGSGKKVFVKKTISKFNPDNKRKRKLLRPVNTASSLGVKL